MLYLELFLYYFLLILIVEKIKNFYLKTTIYIFAYLLGLIDLIAILTKNTHIDLAFTSNIDTSIITIIFLQFKKELILIISLILLGIIFIIFFDKKIRAKIKYKNSHYYLLLAILIFLNFLPNSVLNNLFFTSKQIILSSKNSNLDDILKDLKIKKEDYKSIDEISVKAGKNIVIIYIESLEYNFLDQDIYPNLTPNLVQLSKDKNWTFTNKYLQKPGTGWTTGALYATQTGMPTMFGLQGNAIFDNISSMEILSLGKILNKAGYEQRFLSSSGANFGGTGNFFKLNAYNKIYGSEKLREFNPSTNWGIHDFDLFEEAKKQYKELQKNSKPFTLTLLTIDTHFPNGIYDARFKDKIDANLKGVEYSAALLDYEIKNFIDFIKNEPNYENTVVFIMPDHTIMGNEQTTPVVKNLNKKTRNLWLLSNAKNINLENKEITFYDMPKLILNGAQVQNNAKFINELIPNFDPTDKKTLQKLQDLNLALVNFDKLKKNIKLKIKKNASNEKISVFLDNKFFDKFSLNSNQKRYYKIDEHYNIKGRFTVNKNEVKHIYDETKLKNQITIEKDNDDILLTFYANNFPILRKRENETKFLLKFTKNIGIAKIQALKFTKKELEAKKIEIQLKNANNLNDYFSVLEKLNDPNILIIISIKDEGSRQFSNFKASFDKFNLADLANKSRYSYIGIFKSNKEKIYEAFDNKEISKKLEINNIPIEVISAGFTVGNTSKNIINNQDYSKNRRGLNITIFDLKNKNLLDSFNVDSYADANLTLNR